MSAEPVPTSGGQSQMSLFQHLTELRTRLLWATGGILVSFGLCWWQAPLIFEWCVLPYEEVVGERLSVVALGEGFLTHLRVAFMASLFLSAPWWLLQCWWFIKPGLYEKERRLAVPFLLLTSFFFLAGGWFAYEFVIPAMLDFLVNEASAGFELDIRAENYIHIFGRFLLAMGLMFEAPVLTFFLARMGLISHRFLIEKQRYAIVIMAVLAAVITPTPDVPTMLLVGLPMLALYWLSTLVAWVFRRRSP